MTAHALIPPTQNTSAVSLREKSTEALIQAIHSPGEEAYALTRARVVLRCYFDPDMPEADRAMMIDEFGRALRGLPKWAVAAGFDAWVRDNSRRPAPGDIVKLSQLAMAKMTDELSRRKREAEPAAEPADRTDDEKAAAKAVLDRAGFTPQRIEAVRKAPLAMSVAEAEVAKQAPATHWTHTEAPDSPKMLGLQAARAASPLIQQARAAAGMPPLVAPGRGGTA